MSCCFPPSGSLSLLFGRYLEERVCVARTRLLRRSKMFFRRKAFIGALSRIDCVALIPLQGDAFEDNVTSEGFRFFSETGLVRSTSPLETATWKLPPDSGVLVSVLLSGY